MLRKETPLVILAVRSKHSEAQSMLYTNYYCIKYCNYLIPGVEILWKCTVYEQIARKSVETVWISGKFSAPEIRFNFGILPQFSYSRIHVISVIGNAWSMSALEGQSTFIFRNVDLWYFEECIKIHTALKKGISRVSISMYVFICHHKPTKL